MRRRHAAPAISSREFFARQPDLRRLFVIPTRIKMSAATTSFIAARILPVHGVRTRYVRIHRFPTMLLQLILRSIFFAFYSVFYFLLLLLLLLFNLYFTICPAGHLVNFSILIAN